MCATQGPFANQTQGPLSAVPFSAGDVPVTGDQRGRNPLDRPGRLAEAPQGALKGIGDQEDAEPAGNP